jgi:hypothetical protein
VFAERIVREGGRDTASRLAYAYARSLQRSPSEGERRVLTELLARSSRQFAADRGAARRLVASGQAPAARGVDAVELAAWTQVARAILNLPEVLTRS